MSRTIKKELTGGKSKSHRCRNHGDCPLCVNGRQYFDRKERQRLDNQENEFFGYWWMPDPTDVGMDMADELMERFGFDPNNLDDMRDSGLWF